VENGAPLCLSPNFWGRTNDATAGAPATSSGVQLTSGGVFPGSEIGWTEAFGTGRLKGEEYSGKRSS
jgi:hypothetical protein